jgi:MarR family transcriptional regulator, temperature-dependent positive regulator of motility
MSRSSSSSQLDNSLLHLLHRAGQCAADLFQRELGTNDLTPRQYAVLLTVSHDQGLSQTQIVERTGIDRSTMADLIRRMLKKGVIQRRRSRDDSRAYAVRLTAAGTRVLAEAGPVSQRVDDKILAVLPIGQRSRMLQDLSALVETLAKEPVRQPQE